MLIEDAWINPFIGAGLSFALVFILRRARMLVKQTLGSYGMTCIMLGTMFSMLTMMVSSSILNDANCHVIGSVLLALTIGPWPATIATSVALLIQAVLFGNGGIMAYGANALNLAVIMPWSGYWIYRLVAKKTIVYSVRQLFFAGFAGAVGFSLAALAAVVECKLFFVLEASGDIALRAGTAVFGLNQVLIGSVAEGLVVMLILKFAFLTEWSGEPWPTLKKN